jgi:hypothetical protein
MKFFIPAADSLEQAESVWQSIRAFMLQQGYGYGSISDRRIYSMEYTHDGKECYDVVGGKDRYGHEIIIAMLETPSVFLCCTPNRGVVRGEPILTGKLHTRVTDFERD